MYADIAVCLPLTRTFVYKLNQPARTGCRVIAPFRKREVEGFVVGLRNHPPPAIEIQEICKLVDSEPLIRQDVFELCRWVSDYYVAPLGEVLRSALPPGISPKHLRTTEFSRPRGEVARGAGVISPEPTSPAALSGLTIPPFQERETPPRLNPDQSRALEAILQEESFRTILLYGITGSGKTEVYLRAAGHYLQSGKTTLILVPEIGLTPQLIERFAGRFPGKSAVLHSSLTRRQRIDEWLRIYRGEAPIVIGTRSAVFAPLQNIGLIVVDEEHETSYKQEEIPRYHARDTAIVRSKLAGAVVVLGSATPSMESFHNAESKKYLCITLRTRVEDRPLPDVEVVNMREEYLASGRQVLLSRRLTGAIAERLDRAEQTMILLNRRGFAAFLLCRRCGFTFKCTSCSVAMTYHRGIDKLLCHYCGLAKRPALRCPECDSEYIYFVGEGTEKLEAELKQLFGGARIGRIDRDTMRHVRDYERVLGGFRSGNIDILVGTQIIAKGHDFPRVTLVGVAGADGPLSLPDFRAAERTFQLLTQVAGRSGRGEQPGEVIIQSYFPDHYTFQLACTQRFEDFYTHEARYRKALFYPPFAWLAGITVLDRDPGRAGALARQVCDFLDSARSRAVRILGPAPAPVERIRRVHRHQLLIKSSSRAVLHRILGDLRDHMQENKIAPAKVVIDVDPVSLV